MKRILIVVDSIDFNASSGSKANVALIKNLQKIGYKVTVLHYSRKDIELTNIECINVPEIKFSFRYLLSRTQRLFTRFTKLNMHRFLETIFGFSFTFFNDTKSIKKAIDKIDTSSYDLIFTLSQAASFRPHYAMLGLDKLHNKWIAYVHDPYPFAYYPKPYEWNEPGYRKKIVFFKKVMDKAKRIAFPSKLLLEWMNNFYPQIVEKGMVIPHQIIDINTEDVNLPDFFDSTKFTIVHAGNLLKQRNPKGLLEGFVNFINTNEDAKVNAQLVLVGPSGYHKKLLQQYKKHKNIIIIDGNLKFREVYKLQEQASVNIILEAASDLSPFLPGKFPHCVAVNKPILHLGPNNSEVMRLLGDDYPYYANINDKLKISRVLNEMYNHWNNKDIGFLLNRDDLKLYLSAKFLKTVISI